MRSLFGPLVVLAARADRLSDWVIGEDMASIFLESEAGAPIVVEGNRAAPGLPPTIMDELVVIGSRATVRLAGSKFELLGPKPEIGDFDPDDAFQAGFDYAASHFIECLRSGKPFETSAEDNLCTLALVEDAYRLAGRA